MPIETWIAIMSLALSVGAAIPTLLEKRGLHHLRHFIIAAILTVFVSTSILALIRTNQHKQQMADVKESITQNLSGKIWTFDHLCLQLLDVPSTSLEEALHLAQEEKAIGYKILKFRGPDGEMLEVRGYYLAKQ